MFGKFVNGVFVRAPYRIPEDQAIADGYKPVLLSPAPETDDKHYPVERLEETETEIVRHWEIEDLPAPDPEDELDEAELLNILLGGDEA